MTKTEYLRQHLDAFTHWSDYLPLSQNPDIPSGEPVVGYRIAYRASDGHLYSAFHGGPEHIENILAQGRTEQMQDQGVSEGFYWPDQKTAENYLATYLLHNDIPQQGQMELLRIEGYSADRPKWQREGYKGSDLMITDTVLTITEN